MGYSTELDLRPLFRSGPYMIDEPDMEEAQQRKMRSTQQQPLSFNELLARKWSRSFKFGLSLALVMVFAIAYATTMWSSVLPDTIMPGLHVDSTSDRECTGAYSEAAIKPTSQVAKIQKAETGEISKLTAETLHARINMFTHTYTYNQCRNATIMVSMRHMRTTYLHVHTCNAMDVSLPVKSCAYTHCTRMQFTPAHAYPVHANI